MKGIYEITDAADAAGGWLIVAGSAFVRLPHLPLMNVILLSQVANGVRLPFVLFFMLRLVNRRDLMGAYTTRAAPT